MVAGRQYGFSVEQVDCIIANFEKASQKQLRKATADIETLELEFLSPGAVAAEDNLMSAAEQVRDVCAKALLGTTVAARDYLDDVFGRGCACARFLRIRDVIEIVRLYGTTVAPLGTKNNKKGIVEKMPQSKS